MKEMIKLANGWTLALQPNRDKLTVSPALLGIYINCTVI